MYPQGQKLKNTKKGRRSHRAVKQEESFENAIPCTSLGNGNAALEDAATMENNVMDNDARSDRKNISAEYYIDATEFQSIQRLLNNLTNLTNYTTAMEAEGDIEVLNDFISNRNGEEESSHQQTNRSFVGPEIIHPSDTSANSENNSENMEFFKDLQEMADQVSDEASMQLLNNFVVSGPGEELPELGDIAELLSTHEMTDVSAADEITVSVIVLLHDWKASQVNCNVHIC